MRYTGMCGVKYCGIQSTGPIKVLYTSHPGIGPTCSFWYKFGFSGKHSAMLELLCEDFTRESPAFYHIMLAVMLFVDFIL